mmetsp:Transcript_28682/g.48687  ORF Transcript_28682/g.48687 Transcript_28682/m.48687 type:complete len:181 (+) Transcript_28682:923-1465(+)
MPSLYGHRFGECLSTKSKKGGISHDEEGDYNLKEEGKDKINECHFHLAPGAHVGRIQQQQLSTSGTTCCSLSSRSASSSSSIPSFGTSFTTTDVKSPAAASSEEGNAAPTATSMLSSSSSSSSCSVDCPASYYIKHNDISSCSVIDCPLSYYINNDISCMMYDIVNCNKMTMHMMMNTYG